MDTMTAAKELAWKLYVGRVQSLVNEQFNEWNAGHPTSRLVLTVPDSMAMNTIAGALQVATDDGLHSALGPVIHAIDEIDNSGKQSADTKQHYKRLTEIADTIRAMKSTDLSIAK